METTLANEISMQHLANLKKKPEQDVLQLLKAKLKEGEVEYLNEVMEQLDHSIKKNKEFRLIQIEALCGCGNFDGAQKYAEDFCAAYPTEYVGIRWINFLEVITERTSFQEHEKSERISTIASDELGALLSGGIANYEDLIENIIVSKRYDFSFKEYLLQAALRQVPTETQIGYLEENLVCRFEKWTEQQQLLWTAVCLRNSFSKDSSGLLDQLSKIISKPGLEMSDLVGTRTIINIAVSNSNNMSAYNERYKRLSEVYKALAFRLGEMVLETKKVEADTAGRENKRVAVFCAPLIHVNHAPSNRVLEISSTLKKRYGYELKIFAGGTFSYSVNAGEGNYTTNAMVIPKDHKSIEFSSVFIPIWTSYKDDGQYKKHLEALENIMSFKPDVVLVFGDCHPVQRLLCGKVPTFLIPTISAPPVGDMDAFFSLWRPASLRDKIEKGLWPKEYYQKAVFGACPVHISKPKYKASRKDIIPEAEIIIVLMGSRLTDEIRGPFASRLSHFLSQNPKVYVLIIGGKDAVAVMGKELENQASQIRHFDYAVNLAEIFSGCDIVLNPPRQGGGTGVAIAMSVGCAVVSLEEGDGATLIDPEDLCADLDEYFERLSRLTDSKGFRRINQVRAKHQVYESIGFESGMDVLDEGLKKLIS